MEDRVAAVATSSRHVQSGVTDGQSLLLFVQIKNNEPHGVQAFNTHTSN